MFISVQKYLFQYQKTYVNPKIFISVQKKSFLKRINISQVSLRPAGRREVSLSKWRILMDIQKEATTYYLKKLQIWNYISLPWKVSRYQNINANPKNLLTECGFTFTPAEADRGGMTLMKIKMLLCCIRREPYFLQEPLQRSSVISTDLLINRCSLNKSLKKSNTFLYL